MQWMMAAVLVCGSSFLSSCTEDNGDNPAKPEQTEYKGVPLVIYDTDIGSSTDDLIALEMLHHYTDEGRCRLLGVIVDRHGEEYAALADAMNTYFGHGDVHRVYRLPESLQA